MENDERRRVAQALREMETPTWPTLTEAVMGHVATREKVVGRLADLIDPDTTSVRTKSDPDTTKVPKSSEATPNSHQSCGTEEALTSRVPQCDRDALLALADDVDGAADDSGGFEPLAGMLRDIARCIREACGEAEHGR